MNRIVALGVLLLAFPASAQIWTQMATGGPQARTEHAMAFDSLRGRVVLFGGRRESTPRVLNDTWEWDGQRWLPMSPTVSPPGRSAHGMTFDPVRGVVMMCGARNEHESSQSDTWEYDGHTWTLLQGLNHEIEGQGGEHDLWFDAARGQVLNLCGTGTHAWIGATWTVVAAGGFANGGRAVAYSSVSAVAVLVGGYSSGSSVFNGTSWSSYPTNSNITWRAPALVFDSARGVFVLFGGFMAGNDAWESSGIPSGGTIQWTARATWSSLRPINRSKHAAVFDSIRGKMVMFGGEGPGPTSSYLDDTWEYYGAPAGWQAFGSGCSGSAGAPVLVTGDLPYIGETFQLQLSSLPAHFFNTAFGLIGGSDQAWSGLSLPLSLDLIGGTGCAIHVAIDSSMQLTNIAGTANWTIAIPNDPGLIAQDFFVQGLVIDPLANPLGLVTSNAGEMVIGAR